MSQQDMTSGATCGNCGSWIRPGWGHSCRIQPDPPLHVTWPPARWDRSEEIVQLLKRIIELLEARP